MKKILILPLVSMFTLACGMPKKSDLEFNDSASMQNLNPDMEVDYAMIKSEILAPKCLGCHSDVSTEAGLKGWITPGKPESSPFFNKVEDGSMPKNGTPLSTRELELIRMYITQTGAAAPAPTAPSSSPSPNPAPTPENTGNPGISYAEVKSRILEPYRCTSCHSVGTEAKLASWINTTSPEKSRFYTMTKSGSMPEGGSNVTSDDQAFILQYVKDYSNRN